MRNTRLLVQSPRTSPGLPSIWGERAGKVQDVTSRNVASRTIDRNVVCVQLLASPPHLH
jgi:hypothetical protein